MKHLKSALGAVLGIATALLSGGTYAANDATPVDTALVVSVDVSNSVDEARYKLQMEGIAKALEDPGVIEAITGGSSGGILFSMVSWADKPALVIPWIRIANKADALAAAQRVRKLPHQGGEFTCMTRMLRSANDKIVPQIPAKAARIVIDVSGDGPDNCNADEPIEKVRDELVANGVTINGLPICWIRRTPVRCCPRPCRAASRRSSNGIASTSWQGREVSYFRRLAIQTSNAPFARNS